MLGITQRMLTRQLHELEGGGIVERAVLCAMPPHVEYSLTSEGVGLLPVLRGMATWGAARERIRP